MVAGVFYFSKVRETGHLTGSLSACLDKFIIFAIAIKRITKQKLYEITKRKNPEGRKMF